MAARSAAEPGIAWNGATRRHTFAKSIDECERQLASDVAQVFRDVAPNARIPGEPGPTGFCCTLECLLSAHWRNSGPKEWHGRWADGLLDAIITDRQPDYLCLAGLIVWADGPARPFYLAPFEASIYLQLDGAMSGYVLRFGTRTESGTISKHAFIEPSGTRTKMLLNRPKLDGEWAMIIRKSITGIDSR